MKNKDFCMKNLVFFFMLISLMCCSSKVTQHIEEPQTEGSVDSVYLEHAIMENLKKARVANRNYCPESVVLGHIEEDTIIGCFNGKDIDTLFVEARECECFGTDQCNHDESERVKYYLVSKSMRLPEIQLFAVYWDPPRIVNEGDLDGNGTTEVGYMHTWHSSQWRCYRIFTWYENEWVYLIDPNEEYMETSQSFRLSGYGIAEPGKEKGTVLIHTGKKNPCCAVENAYSES